MTARNRRAHGPGGSTRGVFVIVRASALVLGTVFVAFGLLVVVKAGAVLPAVVTSLTG
ncbi:hypothetical protein [Haladaptatus sp. NG-WS-4]